MYSLLWTEQILRRLDTTGLAVEASQKVHTTVRVLLLPVVGFCHAREALTDLKNASWSNSSANSRPKLVMVPPRLVKPTIWWTMSAV